MASNNANTKLSEPYFARQLDAPAAFIDSGGPNIIFIDFLNRLDGPARVTIDTHQEMLIMALRQRCLRFAFSDDADEAIRTLNQVCALYHQCVIKNGLKTFEVFAAQNEQYINVQEQFYYSREQAFAQSQRPVQETHNLLRYAHDLLEGYIRRLATLGMFALDVIRDRQRASDLSPAQYVELDLRAKEQTFAEDPGLLRSTHARLFGSVRFDIRNAIAHRRYEVQDDGSALLWDFDPRKQVKKPIGQISQSEIKELIFSIERAVAVFEISVLIFQHNNGKILHELGHYANRDATDNKYSEKQMREMLYLNAPACFMRIENIEIADDDVRIDASFLSFESSPLGGDVYVNSKDRNGKPIEYALPLRPRELSARDQTLRLLQIAALYCGNYKSVTVRTKDAVGDKLLGEASATMDLLAESIQARFIPKEEFIQRLRTNTFGATTAVDQIPSL